MLFRSGKQKTLEKDISDWASVRQELFQLVEMVGKKLREENLHARKVHVFVRYCDFLSDSTSKTLKDPTHFDRVLFRYAQELLLPLIQHPDFTLETSKKPIRLVGFTAGDLVQKTPQLDLFRTPKAMRWERFYASLDKIRNFPNKKSNKF